VAPECATMVIPPHLHRAAVQLTHYELGASYGLRDRLQLSLSLPYDVKAMTIRYTTLDGGPFVPPYGDIHHRTETLTGISDPTLSVEWSPRPGAGPQRWLFGLGASLPAGHTVPDPIELGREGKTHEHIQFGSGTFRPVLTAQWSRSGDRVSFVAQGAAQLSLYQNREGFRAPNNLNWSLGPSIRLARLSLDPRLQGQHQSVGRWHGESDEGDGFNNAGLRLQLSLRPYHGITFAPAVYRELYSKGLAGQTFRQGTTWSVSMMRGF
jgi:hypothetical protein